MGWDGVGWMDGWDGHQNGPLIFFILRYIKHYTYTHYDQAFGVPFKIDLHTTRRKAPRR